MTPCAHSHSTRSGVLWPVRLSHTSNSCSGGRLCGKVKGIVKPACHPVSGRFGSEGWHRGQRDSCSWRRAMEAGNVGQRWGERGGSLGGVQRGPGPSAGGREGLFACGGFFDFAGGGVWRGGGVNGGGGLGA